MNLWPYPRAFCCTGPTGAIGTRLSLCPLSFEGHDHANLGRIAPREREFMSWWSLPAQQAGDPIRRSLSAQALASLEYLIVRSRIRRGLTVWARPSFGEGGKPDDDSGEVLNLQSTTNISGRPLTNIVSRSPLHHRVDSRASWLALRVHSAHHRHIKTQGERCHDRVFTP